MKRITHRGLAILILCSLISLLLPLASHAAGPDLATDFTDAKSFVQGTFHGLDELHLQRYLDEFFWRFNRRHRTDCMSFDLLRSVANAPIHTYADLKG